MLSQFVDSFRRPSITRSRHSSMEGQSISNIQLPPGFRFHPSDEELIIHYLQKEGDFSSYTSIYNSRKKALFGEDEWYFFSPRDRKYPNGARPNRRAASGYWKATGKDKPIFSSHGSQSIGVKKALVFYKGHPPNGVKTDWIMQEYRLLDTMIRPLRLRGSMRLDNWVLCRVRQKGNVGRNMSEDGGSPSINMVSCFPSLDQEPCLIDTNTNVDMAANYLYNDCPMLAYIFASQDVPQMRTTSNINIQAGKNNNSYNSVYEDSTDAGNSPFAASFFNSTLNPSKRKPSEGNHIGNYFPTSNMLTNDEAECGDTIQKLYNDGNIEELNFCTQYQFQGTTFNLDPSNSFIEFQDPNQFDFTD